MGVVTTRPSSLHHGAVMKFILLPTLATLLLLLDPVRSQFVFFGNQFGGQQQQPQPRPAAASRPVAPPTQPTIQFGVTSQRFGSSRPAPVRTVGSVAQKSPVRTDLTADRFAGPLFRTSTSHIHKPNKNPITKKEPVKFVEILTEKPTVVKAAPAPANSVAAVVSEKDAAVVLPAPVVTEAAPATTTPAAPTTTTAAPTRTTAAPTTTTAAPTTTTKKPTPAPTKKPTLKIKSFIVNQFGQAVSRPAAPAPVRAAPAAPATPAAESRRPKALPVASKPKGNYQWQGKSYLLTWRNHRNNFDWNGGRQYCQSKGMNMISLDSKEKSEHFLRLVAQDRAPYFWAGGKVSRDSRTLSWENGKSEPVARGQHPWSFTGRTGPQPDGGEVCLAILNSVYRDGVKYHDVACHHRKPVVCEE